MYNILSFLSVFKSVILDGNPIFLGVSQQFCTLKVNVGQELK